MSHARPSSRTTRRRPAAAGPALALLAALLAAGCYTYAPTALSAVRPGMDVRAHLTSGAVSRLRDALPDSGPFLYGTVTSSERDGLILMVPMQLHREGLAMTTVNRRISLPREEITSVDRRVFDRFRTGLLMGLGAVALGVGIYANR